MTLASICGKVISDIDSLNPHIFFISSSIPKELPITKFSVLFPETETSLIFSARFSEESFVPSIHNAILKQSLPASKFRIALASAERAAFISFSEGSSESLLSASSVTVSLQKAFRRFEYSAHASRK